MFQEDTLKHCGSSSKDTPLKGRNPKPRNPHPPNTYHKKNLARLDRSQWIPKNSNSPYQRYSKQIEYEYSNFLPRQNPTAWKLESYLRTNAHLENNSRNFLVNQKSDQWVDQENSEDISGFNIYAKDIPNVLENTGQTYAYKFDWLFKI
jgi:hypothetical protein